MKLLLVGLTMAAFALQAQAQSASQIAASYQLVDVKRRMCRAVLESGHLKARTGAATAADGYREFLQCQSETSTLAKTTYGQLMPKLKGGAAKATLKDYQVAVMNAIEANDQKDGETEFAYKQRIGAHDDKVKAAWNRLELEL